MNELQKTIIDLEVSLLSNEVRDSVSKLDLLLADDFIEFGSSGLIYTKMSVLERLPNKNIISHYEAFEFTVVELAPNICQVRYKTIKKEEGKIPEKALRNSLWRKEENLWKLFFHQGTISLT